MNLRTLLRHTLFALAAGLLAPSAQAAVVLWLNTGTTDGLWSTATNWTGGVIPGATTGTTNTDQASFVSAVGTFGTAANPVLIDAGRNLRVIGFFASAGNYTIGTTGGNALVLSSVSSIGIFGTLTSTNAIETINAPLSLAGSLTISNDSANGSGAGAGTLVIGGGITGTTGTQTVVVRGSNTNANTISGVIGNGTATSVSLNKTDAGTWSLTGANTFTGGVQISDGTLIVNSVAASGVTSALGAGSILFLGTISPNTATARLQFTGASGGSTNRTISLVPTGITGGGGTIENTVAGQTLTFSGQVICNSIPSGVVGLTVTGAGDGVLSGIVSNQVARISLTKSGAGTWTFSGTNTHSGDVTVSGGTLKLGNAKGLGFGGAQTTSMGTTTVESGFTLDLNGQTGIMEPIVLNGAGIGGNGALVNQSGTAASIGDGIAGLAVPATGSGTGLSTAPTVAISGTGTGATATASLGLTTASITSISGGTGWVTGDLVTLSGGAGANAIGTVTASGGAITGVTITSAGRNFTSAPTSIFRVTGSGFTTGVVLTGNATNFTVGALTMTNAGTGYTGTPTVTLGGSPAPLVTPTLSSVALATDSSIGGTGNISIAGVISGSGKLTKVGAGTLTVTGANTYTGNTVISGGTLLASNTAGSGTGTGTVAVDNGGTLGGTGTISGTIAVNTGGTLAPGASAGTLTATNTVTFGTGAIFAVEIGGPTPGTQHDRLSGATVNLGAGVATLSTTAIGGFVPAAGQSYTIITRTGGSGTFAGLPEGATIADFLGSGHPATITYAGGSGSDVVLTMVSYTLTYTAGAHGTISGTTPQLVLSGADGSAVTAVPDAGYSFLSWSDGVLTATRTDTNVTADLSVTANFIDTTAATTADSGARSLRQALANAATAPGPNTITLDAALAGQTIVLTSEIVVDDADGVTIDASGLAGGLTLSGGGTTRILQLASGRSLTLSGLTFTNGNGVGATGGVRGGAIHNNGTLMLTGCTFTGNACAAGGAIRTVGSLSAMDCTFANNTVPNQGGAIIGGTMTLTRCTFTGNSADEGGAVYSGNATVSQCTFSGNTGRSGAAILFNGAMGITHSTVWGNTVTPPGGTAVSNRSAGGTLTLTNSIVEDIMNFGTFTRVGANIVAALNNTGGTDSGPAAITDDPLLAALASNGGPTQTRAVLAGSPAIDAAVGSAITSDQRGQALVGPADLGAYEHPQLAQTIMFTKPGGHTYGDAPFALSASGGASGNPVTFSIVSGPATVLGDMLTITGAGDVTVRASQAGDEVYNAAAAVEQTFTVAKATQTITFPTIANRTYGDAPFAVNATSSSGEGVGLLIVEGYSGVAMFDNGYAGGVAGQNVVINGVGNVTIRASVPESANYLAADDVEQSFSVGKASQAISFTLAGTALTSDTIALSATGGASGNSVTFSIVSGPGSITGNTLSFTGEGTVVVRASQAGNASYLAAPDVERTIVVVPSVAPVPVDDVAYAASAAIVIDVLANDTTPIGTLSLLSVGGPVSGGTTAIVPGNKVRFTPTGPVAAPITFTYTTTNGLETGMGTVTVKPISLLAGTYVGLLRGGDGVVRGSVKVVATATGTFTGVIWREGGVKDPFGYAVWRACGFKGGFANPAVWVPSPYEKVFRSHGITLVTSVEDVDGRPQLVVTSPGLSVATLTGTLEKAPYHATSNPVVAARYTAVAERPVGVSGVPAMAAALTLQVATSGTVTVVGKFGDGRAISQSVPMVSGQRLFFYQGAGYGAVVDRLGGVLTIDPGATPQVQGSLDWGVAPGVISLVPAAVAQAYPVRGYTFVPAVTTPTVFNPASNSGTLTMALPVPVVRTLNLTGLPTLAFTGGSVTLNRTTGAFSGSRVLSRTVSQPIYGVILQGGGVNTGYGWLQVTGSLPSVTITTP